MITIFSLRLKILSAMSLVAAVVVAAELGTSQYFRRERVLKDFQSFVSSVAGTTALAIDGESLSAIQTDIDASKPEFAKSRDLLFQSQQINHLAESEIYILRPDPSGDMGTVNYQMTFVVMLQKKPFIGHRYQVSEINRATLRAAWQSNTPRSTSIYSDVNGTYISGYAAIRNAQGQPVGIIEVDAEISRFIREARAELWLGLGIGLAAFAVAMLPGLLLAQRITRGITQLTDCVRRFRMGDHQVEAASHNRDEVGELGSVFNEMLLSLREKLALLPYVSRFTAEAVRRSHHDPNWLAGSEQEIIVLFADLRGFTAFSESREAADIVRELNGLLSVQANVVVSAGGDVDKFIGDAIMAVFLGAETTPEIVWECARQLIEKIRELTKNRGWQLSLGIGIHCGRAVVGSIGSETRRDFTAMGHAVNVASRFCDVAGHWEILTSDAFYKMLPESVRQHFSETKPLKFKNLSQPVRTWSSLFPNAADQGAATPQPDTAP